MGSLAKHSVMVGLHKGMSLYGDLLLNKYQGSAQVHTRDYTSWEVGLSQACMSPVLQAAHKLQGCTIEAGTKYHCTN